MDTELVIDLLAAVGAYVSATIMLKGLASLDLGTNTVQNKP